MIKYSIHVSAFLNDLEPDLYYSVEFATGNTPILPHVGDEFHFASGGRAYSVTVEKRFFSCENTHNADAEITVLLVGEAIDIEDASCQ